MFFQSRIINFVRFSLGLPLPIFDFTKNRLKLILYIFYLYDIDVGDRRKKVFFSWPEWHYFLNKRIVLHKQFHCIIATTMSLVKGAGVGQWININI